MSGKKKNYSLNKDHQDLIKLCKNMFGKDFQHEIILTVAQSQNWDTLKTIEILSDMSNKCVPSFEKQIGVNSMSYDKRNQTADVIIESEGAQKNVSYSKMASNQSRNFPPSKTGAKKKQFSMNNPKKNSNNNRIPKSKKELEIDRVKSDILKGHQVMIILRGLPGSGKSTLARNLVSQTIGSQMEFHIFSTDDYLVQDGVYRYNRQLLSEAHNWNQKRVFEAAQLGISPIIIDNTNTEAWEARPYAMQAVQFGYKLQILEPNTPWFNNPSQLSLKNIHNVPKAKISEMKDRYEDFDANALLAKYNLKYLGKKPPILRKIPPISINQQSSFSQKHGQPIKQQSNKQKRPSRKQNYNPTTQNSASSIGTDFKIISPSEVVDNLSDTWESDTEGSWEEINPITSKSEEELPEIHDLINFNEFEMEQNRSQSSYNDPFKPQLSLIDLDLVAETQNSPQQHCSGDSQDNTSQSSRELCNTIGASDLAKNSRSYSFGPDFYKKVIDIANDSSTFDRNFNSHVQKVIDEHRLETHQVYPVSEEINNENRAPSERTPVPNFDTKEEPHKSNLAYEMSRRLINSLQNFMPQNLMSQNTKRSVEIKEIGINTSSLDLIAQKSQESRILIGRSRNLTDSTKKVENPKVQKKMILEKGTMTDLDELLVGFLKDENLKTNFYTLLNLFPQVEEEILTDIYDKCQFDVNWAVDILLENGIEVSYANDGSRKSKSDLKNIDSNFDNKSLDTNDSQKSNYQNKIKYRAPVNQETQKILNDLFQIPDEHYSSHILNLRKKKFGLVDSNFGESSTQEEAAAFEEGSFSSKDQENDLEYDELESESENECIELNFGREFINQLEQEFGNTDTEYLDRLLPVMQVPRSLACQLHAIWMESMYYQIEMQSNVIQEIERQDSELAKKLQDEEARALETELNPQAQVPSLQEIIDMELALAIYCSDNKQWKKTPDDLASKMTRQKLFEAFPELDKNDLCEILQAHDNCFDETVQSLLNSLGRTENDMLANIDGKIVAKNALNEVEKQKELLERTKNDMHSLKIIQESKKSGNFEDYSDSDDEINICKKGANYYREKASYHLQARQKLYQKANDCIKKRQPQVAGYYLDVAKLHMQKYEIENSRAACAFLSEHSLNHHDQRVLDLHKLYVKEAEQALAMFLDGQISRLQQMGKPRETLFIITGRGKNSIGGIAQIKPVVKRRLKERKLRFAEMNPGCLKVIISKHSLITNDLKN